jgi:hypothetical protein
VFQQVAGEGVQLEAIPAEGVQRPFLHFADDALDLLVDQAGGVLRVVPLLPQLRTADQPKT